MASSYRLQAVLGVSLSLEAVQPPEGLHSGRGLPAGEGLVVLRLVKPDLVAILGQGTLVRFNPRSRPAGGTS